MQGQLFTQYFLTDGITSTADWDATFAHPDAFNTFRDGARRLFDAFDQFNSPNEATTEQELIRPLLELLGWADYLPQQGAARNEDIPDLLLFADADAKSRAAARTNPNDRFLDAAVVAESKRRGPKPLDAREAGGPLANRHAARPDAALPAAGGRRHRRRPALGHPHRRRRLAALRPARPPPRHRLLRGRPGSPHRRLRPLPPVRLRPLPPVRGKAGDGGLPAVIPAEAGIQSGARARQPDLDPGVRRGDGDPASPVRGELAHVRGEPVEPRPSTSSELAPYLIRGRTDGHPPSTADPLRTFYLLFRRQSFVLRPGATATFLETALARGTALRAAGGAGPFGRGLRARLSQPHRRAAGRRRREPGRRAAGGADTALPPALRALCRRPRPAAGQRLPLRRLRAAQAGPRRHRAAHGRRRHLLVPRRQLLRPRDDAGGPHRHRRRFHRSAALQRRPVRRRRRAAAEVRAPARRGLRPHRPRPQPRRDRRPPQFVNYRDMSGAAAWLALRAPAGAGAGAQQPGRHRHSAQSLRAQGQRQLLHAAGAGGLDPGTGPSNRWPRSGSKRSRTRPRRYRATAVPGTNGAPSCGGWTRPRRCWS